MHEKIKTKSKALIALALCFCVMALTSFLAVKSSLNKISEYSSGSADSTSSAEEKQAAAQTPLVDSKSGESGTGSGDSGKKTDYIVPVSGKIQLGYSMDSLVYSKTLDQYMTHPGIDIAADTSTDVKAIADGTVSEVYSDDRYGMTVCITHETGLISVYSNLAPQGLAETGDTVQQGDIIGCVGTTALFESLESSHLHFEIRKDGNSTDPGKIIDEFSQ